MVKSFIRNRRDGRPVLSLKEGERLSGRVRDMVLRLMRRRLSPMEPRIEITPINYIASGLAETLFTKPQRIRIHFAVKGEPAISSGVDRSFNRRESRKIGKRVTGTDQKRPTNVHNLFRVIIMRRLSLHNCSNWLTMPFAGILAHVQAM